MWITDTSNVKCFKCLIIPIDWQLNSDVREKNPCYMGFYMPEPYDYFVVEGRSVRKDDVAAYMPIPKFEG